MNQYLSSASLKSLAKGQLLGKYPPLIGALVLMQLCTAPLSLSISFLIGTDSIIGVLIYSAALFLLQLFVGFFIAGEAYIYLKTACGQRPTVADLFHCFRGDTSKVVYLQAILGGVSVLCSLPAMIIQIYLLQSINLSEIDALTEGTLPFNAVLFLAYVIVTIVGLAINIIIDLMLSQVFYLMLDFPGYSASQLLKMSVRLMKGNKGRLFYIQLSFVPLLLLSLLSCGIAVLWIHPYMQATYANFYLDLIKKKSK
ncbi:MAG: DUF975 family protein [Suilimivivens sp.]